MRSKPSSGAPPSLIEAARRGDKKSLEKLLSLEQARIYAYGLKMCRNPEDARDVAQETMLAMSRSLHDFRGDAALSTWMFQIARSFCIKKRRRRKGAPAETEDVDGMALADPRPGPEQTLGAKEMEAALGEALESLPLSAREVLVLRDVEGLTAPEVAKVLGTSVLAVKSKLHRARIALEKSLGPRLGHERPRAKARKSCPDVVALYSQQLEGELTASVCHRMAQHVAECPACASACDSLKESLALCQRLPTVPAELRDSVRSLVRDLIDRRPTDGRIAPKRG